MATEEDIRTLQDLEERRAAAMLAADTGTLDGLLHDGLTYMHSTGGADTKASYLDGVGSGAFDYRKVDRDDVTIKVQGDIGMVFYHLNADVVIRGNLRNLDNRVLAVWTREDGGWRLLAVQSGAIPEPAP
jgi:ketosteroid isomerase-like protein